MKRFRYRAKDIHGKTVTGIMRAEQENQVYKSLREAGLFVVSMKELSDQSRTRSLNQKTLADFSKQMSVMLKSGIPMVQAVQMLAGKENNEKLAQIYKDVSCLLFQGYSMSEALRMQRGVFPVMMVNMVNAGETAGHMADTMMELAIYYEKSYRLRKKIVSSLIYPVFLLVVILLGLILLFVVVLPEFFELFDSLESLPASTRFLIWMSSHLASHGILLVLVLILMTASAICLTKYKKVRFYTGKMLLHLPVIGPLVKTIYTARFSRTMNALYDNGVSMVRAVGVTSAVMGNEYLEQQLQEVLAGLCNGSSLSSEIMKVDGFDQSLAVNIFIGEETGELETLLGQVADRFDTEAGEAAGRLTTLIEPVMIVGIGMIVGFIMLSVMMPLMQYYKSIG